MHSVIPVVTFPGLRCGVGVMRPKGPSKESDHAGELIAALGLPRTLSEVGVGADLYPAIAEGALGNMWVRTNPRPIESTADVMTILEMAAA